MGNIGNGTFVTDEIPGSGFLEMGIENTVETAGFIYVAVYTVFDALRGVSVEVVGLSLPVWMLVVSLEECGGYRHWTNTGV